MKTDMKAMVIHQYKDELLSEEMMPIPNINPDEVRVKIKAASINPIDSKIKDGELKILLTYQFPLILGNDFSGIITEVGSNVKQFKVGDEVYGRPRKTQIGTFAEYIAVNEADIALKPSNVSFEEAASLPLVGLTSYQALNDIMQLKQGDKVLIQAGAGGVGTFAIQLAKSMGLYVATTASPKGFDLVSRLGADEIINYREQSFWNELSDYDGVFDTLGGDNLNHAFEVLKKGGTVTSISGIPTEKTGKEMKIGFVKTTLLRVASAKLKRIAKQYSVNYEFLFMKPSGQQLEVIRQLVENGSIKPVIDKVYDFKETQAALEYSNSGRAKGKIIVKMED
ncbi:NADP-dependent oxidoreductase [Staphylococcus warneri]|nr:NADPH:quinone reductase [Staphylococcus warneri]QJX54909.1 NADP-dependent oxidoreductase [Staphylococcus warneri]